MGAKIHVWNANSTSFWCPACNEAHRVSTSGARRWSFTGPPESPSMHPSLNISWTDVDGVVRHRCHSNISGGRITYADDCSHVMKGQTADLPDWVDGRT